MGVWGLIFAIVSTTAYMTRCFCNAPQLQVDDIQARVVTVFDGLFHLSVDVASMLSKIFWLVYSNVVLDVVYIRNIYLPPMPPPPPPQRGTLDYVCSGAPTLCIFLGKPIIMAKAILFEAGDIAHHLLKVG